MLGGWFELERENDEELSFKAVSPPKVELSCVALAWHWCRLYSRNRNIARWKTADQVCVGRSELRSHRPGFGPFLRRETLRHRIAHVTPKVASFLLLSKPNSSATGQKELTPRTINVA